MGMDTRIKSEDDIEESLGMTVSGLVMLRLDRSIQVQLGLNPLQDVFGLRQTFLKLGIGHDFAVVVGQVALLSEGIQHNDFGRRKPRVWTRHCSVVWWCPGLLVDVL